MFAVGWITASLNKNDKDKGWNYGIPIDANMYLVVGIFVQVSLQCLQQTRVTLRRASTD